MIKDIALKHIHEALGAKIVPFAGYNMPVQYSGVNDEHNTVRTAMGVFDVSHMGEFFLSGDKALDLIQLVTSNDASKLVDGQIQYSCLPNNEGGIVDDLLVYRINATQYLLVVNASNIDKDWTWISQHNCFDVTMVNRSEEYSLLAVQGPKAILALQKLTAVNLSAIPYYNFKIDTMAGLSNVIISNTGYTGSGGFEIYVKNADAEKMWNAIIEAGAEYGIKPIGLAARDTLRLEMGFCLYGNDINDTTSPIEAGLGWITKFTKSFVNDAHHKAIKENGATKKLVGFKMIDRGIPRHDYELLDAEGNNIGIVTSGTQSPSLQKAIGMGYVAAAFANEGTEIFVNIRNTPIKAVVVKFPFYKDSPNK